jgi:hypothetical protein
MGLQVAFAWDEKSAKEMERMGFEKREVFIKRAPNAFPLPEGKTHTEHEKALGDSEFFGMESPPYQFATVDYWGAGPG